MTIESDLTAGALAARAGTTVSALRFYERQGLLAPPRTRGNQPRYRAEDLSRVRLILLGRTIGQPVPVIRDLLRHLPTSRPAAQPEWVEVFIEMRSRLDDEIARLQQLREKLLLIADDDHDDGTTRTPVP